LESAMPFEYHSAVSALPLALRVCRGAAGLSQRDMSMAVSRQRTYISKVETGHATPKCESLLVFARGLNLSPRFILEIAEAMCN
jgi:transcriptional regulator with XRE-family HTH domain